MRALTSRLGAALHGAKARIGIRRGMSESESYAVLLEEDVRREIDRRGLPRIQVTIETSGDRGLGITVQRRLRDALELGDDRRRWGDDRTSDRDAVLDLLRDELRRSVGMRELARHNTRTIRRADGSTRPVELAGTPPWMNSGHPAVVALARMIGIGAEHLAHPASGHDAQRAVVHTTPWPEREYWRVSRKPVDGIRIRHTLTIGKAGLGMRGVSSDADGVRIDIGMGGQLPETMLVAIQAGGLAALVDGFRLPEGSRGGDAIAGIEIMPARLWRDNATVYRIRVEDAPYVPLETPPEGVDMSWMDADWNLKRD